MTATIIGVALALIVGLLAHVVGYDRDRSFYAVVLTVVGSLYVLFNLMAGGGHDLVPEIAFFAFFAALAIIGFRMSLWIVAAGLLLHGVFDFFRHFFSIGRGIPEWWPAFCGAYDVAAAICLVTLLLVERQRPAPSSRVK